MTSAKTTKRNSTTRKSNGPNTGQKTKPRTTVRKGKKPAKIENKTNRILSLLRSPTGTTVAGLSEATGWQAHSVRGFLSGTVKKKLGLKVISEIDDTSLRRYRIVDGETA